MGYSNEVNLLCDDVNVFKYAWKRADFHRGELGGIIDMIEKPFVFLGALIGAPFNRINNIYCYGTPEWEERTKKIRVYPNSRGIGVRVEYPE